MTHTTPAAPAASTIVRDEITSAVIATLPFRAVYGTPVGGHSIVMTVSHGSTFVSTAVARRVA